MSFVVSVFEQSISAAFSPTFLDNAMRQQDDLATNECVKDIDTKDELLNTPFVEASHQIAVIRAVFYANQWKPTWKKSDRNWTHP